MEKKEKKDSSFKRMMNSFRKSMIPRPRSSSTSSEGCDTKEGEFDLESIDFAKFSLPGCSVHENQAEVAFCPKCEAFLCAECRADSSQHSDCGLILDLDTAHTSHFVQTRLGNIKTFRMRMMEIRMELYDYMSHLEVARRQHWRDAWTARRMILDLSAQVITSVETQRDTLLDELDSCEEGLNERLDYFLNESEALLKRQTKALSEIDQLLSTPFGKSFMNQYRYHTETHNHILKVGINSEECVKAVNTRICFTPEKSFMDATKVMQKVNMGTVATQPPPGLTDTVYENTATKRWFTRFSKIGDFLFYLHPPPITPRLLSDVLSRSKSESSHLRDVIALPDQQYVVIDGGEVVSRYSADGFSTGKIPLMTEENENSSLDNPGPIISTPIDIRACCGCRWSKDRLALTLPNGEIRIVNMASDMNIESKGKLKKKYWGVAKVNERTLACVACVSPTIDLIRVEGDTFKVVKSLRCEFGPNTTRARYVTVTPDLCLVVTDGNIIQGLDFQGNTKFLIRSIAYPSGVAADSTYIYVCDRALDRILRFTTKGEIDCVLLTKDDGLSNPEGIDVTNNGWLLVTKWPGGRVLTFTLNETMV